MELIDFKNRYIEAYNKIKEAKNILLITHEKPDGDGLSSICALSLFFDSLNINYTLFCIDKNSSIFNFLPNIHKLTNNYNFNLSEFDIIIPCDCGSIKRTAISNKIKNETSSNQLIIEFDHHPHVDDYSNIEIRIPHLSSTAEVLYHFFKFNNIKMTKEISNCILTGILTDTGNLLYSSTSENTIKASSDLLLKGADYKKITKQTWQNKSITSMRIWGVILDNLRVNKDHNLAYSVISYEEIQNFSHEIKNTDVFDSVTSFLGNIEGVKAIMFIREEEKGTVKGSLRTNYEGIDISQLAKQFGGGGHPKASGFKLKGSIIKTEDSWKII